MFLLDIRLTTFAAVARIKSFTKAGEILNLSQPAVSQHIKYLEEYYGVSLFKKQGKDITLTEEGKILYEYAGELERMHRNLESALRNAGGMRRIYHLGATMTIGGYVLPHILAEYKKAYRTTDIILQVNNTEEIIDKLLNRKIDFALVEGNFDKRLFKYRKFKDDEMVLAVSSSHDFAHKGAVDIEEVLRGNLILRERGSGTREIFENRLGEVGYDVRALKPYMEIGSISAIKALVEENLGYTIISRETIKRELKSGTIKIVKINGLEINREFNLIYLEANHEKFIEQFISFCQMAE